MKIDKNYKPNKIEQKIYKLWEDEGYFKPQINRSKNPFVIIMPPPNANNALHVGNAVAIAIEDIMIRYHRLKGEPVLWVPGTDHAGIMTQVVYERELAKKGKSRFDLGRNEFYKQTYAFTMKNRQVIRDQLKKLGASCDWTREKFTLDPDIKESVYETFKRLYGDGLVYQGERIINWCPRCQTALSDLEVVYKEEQTKLTYIKYPVVGSGDFITVATTRPETMLGDTAVAVNPKDKRYKKFLKNKTLLKLPLTDRIIPLIAAKEVDVDFGTGAVKVTPAHDPLDFKIGREHNLKIIQVIGKDAKMTAKAGKNYQGLATKECAKKVILDLKKLGLLAGQTDYAHSVGVCERCRTTIEPLVSKQWFIRTKPLAEAAISAVKSGKIKFYPKRFEKIFYHWMENIKDWCISRQIWWGQRMPVWRCKKCSNIAISKERPKKCKKCGSKDFVQESDTFDTWFSSGQWPFLVFGWPRQTRDFRYFYPTTVMETGWDILFFWVARMIMLGIYCTGKPPFKYVYLHGLVRDKDRQKMSKSKGNVVNPLEVVDLYGSDALRMALVFGSGPGNDIIISEEKIVGQAHFINKIWNAARFVLLTIQQEGADFLKKKKESFSFSKNDKLFFDNLARLLKEVDSCFNEFNFHKAAEKIYKFFWHNYCDRTIEDTKRRIKEAKRPEDKEAAEYVLYYGLVNMLKILHPFVPYVSESIYQMLPKRDKKALIIENWPREKDFKL
ncbi:valine--tRNA ligase [bacterium]|nr:valine--tRNA ligase [bacterium]